MRVALAQLATGSDRDSNLSVLRDCVHSAAENGAELLLLPEACAYRGEFDPAMVEDVDGPALSEMRAAAAEHGVAVLIGGLWTRSADPARPYNSSLFVDERGDVLAGYRKTHLFRVADTEVDEDESTYTTPGGELVTVAWRDWVFGLSICYDLRFPELYRALAVAGADVLCVPANFSAHTGKHHWEPLLRARAIENLCYVAAPAQSGTAPDGFVTHGHSMMIDPWGRSLAEAGAGTEAGLLFAELSRDELGDRRAAMRSPQEARPELYAATVRRYHGA